MASAPDDLSDIHERLASLPDPLAFLVGIFSSTPHAIQVYQASGRSLLVNPAFRCLFQSEPPPEYNVLKDEIAAARGVLPLIHRAFAGEVVQAPATWYDPRDLQQVKIEHARRAAIKSTFFPLFGRDGAVSHVVMVHQDVTADTERRELLEAIIEQSAQGIIVADEHGTLRIFNAEAARQHGRVELGVPAEGWTRTYGLHRLDGSPLPLAESPLYRALQGERVEESHWLVERPDGTRRRLAATAAPLRRADGSRAGAVLITRDETERVDLEEKLQAAAREREALLERERQARSDAESANRAKDAFMAMLGHELRNPLAPIATALQLLRQPGRTDTGRVLDILDRQVGHMVRLVDDLLDVSRVTRGKITLRREPLELARVVADAIETASPLLEERRHHLERRVPPGLRVTGDAHRLAQVVANLLTNAAKYTDPGGRIEVIGERAPDGWLLLRVRDNGIGIPAELLPRVFGLFEQGPQTIDRRAGGLGLGLTLVRSLVELHGGSVAARSEGPGKGSEFELRLPSAEPSAKVPAPAAPEEPRPTACRQILVVDDNIDAAETLLEILQAFGHEVRLAHDGHEALRLVDSYRPDLGILDIGLPVMDGYELAARLREKLPELRLIAVTGYGQEQDRARSIEAGFTEHLVKPVPLPALLAAVRGPDG